MYRTCILAVVMSPLLLVVLCHVNVLRKHPVFYTMPLLPLLFKLVSGLSSMGQSQREIVLFNSC